VGDPVMMGVDVGEPGAKAGVEVTVKVSVGTIPGAVGVTVKDLEQPVIVPLRARIKRKIIRM